MIHLGYDGKRRVAMRTKSIPLLRSLEGRYVCLALADGSRIDDCQLVSAGRPGIGTLWVFTNGRDAFLPLDEVVDLWEPVPVSAPSQAA